MKLQYLEAGQIVTTHGVRGEMKILPWADGPEFLLDFDTFYLKGKPYEVLSSRVHKTCVLAKLKGIDTKKRECGMGIHLRDDSVKEKGYGTQAERLILQYAFEELGMIAVNADAVLKNTRSQHVLEKVGFQYVREDDVFKYYRCEKK